MNLSEPPICWQPQPDTRILLAVRQPGARRVQAAALLQHLEPGLPVMTTPAGGLVCPAPWFVSVSYLPVTLAAALRLGAPVGLDLVSAQAFTPAMIRHLGAATAAEAACLWGEREARYKLGQPAASTRHLEVRAGLWAVVAFA